MPTCPPIRGHLPRHTKDVCREVFKHAFASHAGDEWQGATAHRSAWAAVKRSYWQPLHASNLGDHEPENGEGSSGLLDGKPLKAAITSSSLT